MSPNVILVMRHAEKPTDDHDPHLSPPGKERAEKLATYIPDTFGKPGLCLRGRGLKKERKAARDDRASRSGTGA